jgi:hypothetical protein
MAEFEKERVRPSVSNEYPDDARTPLVKTRKTSLGIAGALPHAPEQGTHAEAGKTPKQPQSGATDVEP